MRAGCKNGPRVTVYIVDIAGDVNPKEKVIPFSAVVGKGLACLSPSDTRRSLRNCKFRNEFPDGVYCLLGDKDTACSDGLIRQHAEIINWSCLDAIDQEEYQNFCRKRASDKLDG